MRPSRLMPFWQMRGWKSEVWWRVLFGVHILMKQVHMSRSHEKQWWSRYSGSKDARLPSPHCDKFLLQPTGSKAGLLLQVFQIRSSDTPTVWWNRGMQFDCRLGPGTSHWQLLHERLRLNRSHSLHQQANRSFATWRGCLLPTAILQFTHTIWKNS